MDFVAMEFGRDAGSVASLPDTGRTKYLIYKFFSRNVISLPQKYQSMSKKELLNLKNINHETTILRSPVHCSAWLQQH
jgi:hypothetical protein